MCLSLEAKRTRRQIPSFSSGHWNRLTRSKLRKFHTPSKKTLMIFQAVAAVEGKGAMPIAPSISRQVCPTFSPCAFHPTVHCFCHIDRMHFHSGLGFFLVKVLCSMIRVPVYGCVADCHESLEGFVKAEYKSLAPEDILCRRIFP